MNRQRPVAGFGLAAALALACGGGGAGSGAGAAAGTMPAYELASLSGAEVAASEFAGKVVLYDFWATWCGPCHLQADIFRKLYPGLRAQGVEIVGIATGESPAVVREFAAKRPFPWPVLIDSEETLSNQLDILGLPTLVIVDREGRIRFRNTGVVGADEVETAVAEALAR